jgi:hypothetical protein
MGVLLAHRALWIRLVRRLSPRKNVSARSSSPRRPRDLPTLAATDRSLSDPIPIFEAQLVLRNFVPTQ